MDVDGHAGVDARDSCPRSVQRIQRKLANLSLICALGLDTELFGLYGDLYDSTAEVVHRLAALADGAVEV